MSKSDGGPAFPGFIETQGRGCSRMVAAPGGYEFETHGPGMTLRDWFAGMAMMGMHTNVKLNNDSTGHIALEAYTQADAMIAEREKA